MLARTNSYIPLGLEALPIHIEVDASEGLPGFTLIGLPDQAVKEAKDRVRAAILNSNYNLPFSRLTVNLAPADLKKAGGSYDLAIALGLLTVTGEISQTKVNRCVFLGELALDGRVRPVAGVLPCAIAHRARPSCPLLVPQENAAEASLVEGIQVIPIATLQEAVAFLSESPQAPLPMKAQTLQLLPKDSHPDFADVKGQAFARRALEVAVCGGHHILLIGPPGSGKSMLAQRIPSILPTLSRKEAIETLAILSISGLMRTLPKALQRPFRSPHHSSSSISLIGGGSEPKPGEISLSHHGVLFLDELPEFRRDVLECLRQPLEDGTVQIARAKRSLVFPARCMLVAAMNPCPCGFLTDHTRQCRCATTQVHRYLAKVSGPVLDRIDLHIEVPALAAETISRMNGLPDGEPSIKMRERVETAQEWRKQRGQHTPNARLNARELGRYCIMNREAVDLLKTALVKLRLSARSYTKIVKVARTIADLERKKHIESIHMAEAIQYRSLDRQLWS